jgi:predicted ATPase
LEQVNANKHFRELAEFFADVRYLHIVPQLIRDPERSVGRRGDPYGGDFLERLARTPIKTRKSRLRRIQDALKVAVPKLQELRLEQDERGFWHLEGRYEHWRPNAGWQSEDQFSDGTLRLLGLLWVFLDGKAPLLLEEPELSLHPAVVQRIPGMLGGLSIRTGRQILLSSHSADLLSDKGIAPEEVLLLRTTHEGTNVEVAATDLQIRALLEGGRTIGQVVLHHTAPANVEQLTLFGENGK